MIAFSFYSQYPTFLESGLYCYYYNTTAIYNNKKKKKMKGEVGWSGLSMMDNGLLLSGLSTTASNFLIRLFGL